MQNQKIEALKNNDLKKNYPQGNKNVIVDSIKEKYILYRKK